MYMKNGIFLLLVKYNGTTNNNAQDVEIVLQTRNIFNTI